MNKKITLELSEQTISKIILIVDSFNIEVNKTNVIAQAIDNYYHAVMTARKNGDNEAIIKYSFLNLKSWNYKR